MAKIRLDELEAIVMEVVHEMLEEGDDGLVRLMMEYERSNGDTIEESVDNWVKRTTSILKESINEMNKRESESLITEEGFKMLRYAEVISEGANRNDVRNLQKYVDSTPSLYKKFVSPAIRELARKMAKDAYNDTVASKVWLKVADEVAKAYFRKYGDPEANIGDPRAAANNWNDTFSKATRLALAEELRDTYYEEVEEMSYDF